MQRYFNTSGPNIPSQHYTLMRENLIAKGMDFVEKERYFTIWAPRQTGKSTYFMLLKTELEKVGYKVVNINLESFMGASLRSFMTTVRSAFKRIDEHPGDLKDFADLFNFINDKNDIKLVLIIDKIEGLNPELFGQFLHTIRNLYHYRDINCLKSVILVGVSNIVGILEDNASPFNIADNINIPYFSTKETFELLRQHELETGQSFDMGVIERIVA